MVASILMRFSCYHKSADLVSEKSLELFGSILLRGLALWVG